MKWAYIGNNLITWSAEFIIHKLGGGSSVCFWITNSLKLYTQAPDLCQKKLKFEIIFLKILGAISKTTASILGLFVLILLCLFYAKSKYGNENLNFENFEKVGRFLAVAFTWLLHKEG